MKKTLLIVAVLALTASCGWLGLKKQVANSDTDVEVGEVIEAAELETNQADSQETDYVVFEIERIDSVRYFAAKKDAPAPQAKPEAITDIEKAKEMLAGRVVWCEYDDEGKMRENPQGKFVYEMKSKGGKIWSDGHLDGLSFVAYYPQEDVMLLEGLHSDDISFDLTTGEDTESAGNPQYIIFSPSRKHRTNGIYSGQEFSIWFIQTKAGNNKYRKIIRLNEEFESATGDWLCDIGDVFWLSDTELYFFTGSPSNEYKPEMYCRLILK
jgi:hypothetical protein